VSEKRREEKRDPSTPGFPGRASSSGFHKENIVVYSSISSGNTHHPERQIRPCFFVSLNGTKFLRNREKETNLIA
jgi:hypothetical protein